MTQDSPAFPAQILVDLTSHCNHACAFCANPKILNKATAPLEAFLALIAEARSLGARELGIFGTGEPFLYPQIDLVVGKAKELGYRHIFVKTNGSLLTEQKLEQVFRAGLDLLQVSVGGGPDTYRLIHRRDDFPKVKRNLEMARKLRDSGGFRTKIAISHVRTAVTAADVPGMQRELGPFVDHWDFFDLHNQCGNKPENQQLSELPGRSPKHSEEMSACAQPFRGLTITPEGFVSACDLDFEQSLLMGDTNKHSLGEIWNSAVYKGFRRRHLEGELRGTACYNCVHNTTEPVAPVHPEMPKRAMRAP